MNGRGLCRAPVSGWRRGRSRPAFSLVELLTAVGILAVLAAVLFYGVAASVDRARSTSCASNLRHIGAALLLYAADNHGTLKARDYSGYINGPDGTFSRSWASHINPYLTNGVRYDGKEETTSPLLRSPFGEDETWNGVSYMANIYLGGYNRGDPLVYAANGRSLYTAENPGEILIMAPGRCMSRQRLDFDITRLSHVPGYFLLDRNNGVNVLYLDNSTAYLRPMALPEAEARSLFYTRVRQWQANP